MVLENLITTAKIKCGKKLKKFSANRRKEHYGNEAPQTGGADYSTLG